MIVLLFLAFPCFSLFLCGCSYLLLYCSRLSCFLVLVLLFTAFPLLSLLPCDYHAFLAFPDSFALVLHFLAFLMHFFTFLLLVLLWRTVSLVYIIAFARCFSSLEFVLLYSCCSASVCIFPTFVVCFLLYRFYWLLCLVSPYISTTQVHHMNIYEQNSFILHFTPFSPMMHLSHVCSLALRPEFFSLWSSWLAFLCAQALGALKYSWTWKMPSWTLVCFFYKQLRSFPFHFHWRNYRETTTAKESPNATHKAQISRTRINMDFRLRRVS